jgi:hypothetical protein
MRITVHCINPQNMAYWQKPKNYMREMDFERDYMPGNVAAEMGDCQETEALKAQAIAARSFAYQYLLKNAAIYDTGKAQAFLASRAASKNYLLHRQAAEETEGIVVCYNGKPCNTHYSHSNGGYVKKSSNKWEPGGYADPWDDQKKNGHGSGMSQVGAENMAKAGKTYREILAFYYPGTVLAAGYGDTVLTEIECVKIDEQTETEVTQMAQKTKMQAVIDFMRAQVGEPYDLGDHGPDKWDCSGLTMEAVEEIGLYWPHSSHYQWTENIKPGGDFNAYGTRDTLDRNKSAFLFNYGERTNGEMGMVHVGAYDAATGTILQAGGYGSPGVSDKPYNSGWFSHWATLKVADELIDAPETPQDKPTSTLRIGSQGDLVRELQYLLNADVLDANLKVDGKFGPLTEGAVMKYQSQYGLKVDGIVGPQTWKSLWEDKPEPSEEPEIIDDPLFAVTVYDLDAAARDTLVAQFPRTTYTQQE